MNGFFVFAFIFLGMWTLSAISACWHCYRWNYTHLDNTQRRERERNRGFFKICECRAHWTAHINNSFLCVLCEKFQHNCLLYNERERICNRCVIKTVDLISLFRKISSENTYKQKNIKSLYKCLIKPNCNLWKTSDYYYDIYNIIEYRLTKCRIYELWNNYVEIALHPNSVFMYKYYSIITRKWNRYFKHFTPQKTFSTDETGLMIWNYK